METESRNSQPKKSRGRRLAGQALPALVILGVWQATALLVERGEFFLGSPRLVAGALAQGLRDGSLVRDICVTGGEATIGFAVGTLVGSITGAALWYSPFLRRLASPYITAAGAIPVFALAPILVVWLGIGFMSKVAIAAMSTVFVALSQAYGGASAADQSLMMAVRSFGAARWQQFRYVAFPSSISWVAAGCKLNVGYALLGAFLGEIIASDAGLGHRIMIAMGVFDNAGVILGALAFGGLAMGMTAGLRFILARSSLWTETDDTHE